MDLTSLNKALVSKQQHQIVQIFNSGQILCLKPQYLAGIILQKPYFADFAGSGAVIGGAFDLQCTSVYLLGAVEITVPENPAERQSAFRQRIAYINSMQEMSQLPSPLRRGHAIIAWLANQFGQEEVSKIPHPLLASLVGVLPETIAIAWNQYEKNPQADQQSFTQVA